MKLIILLFVWVSLFGNGSVTELSVNETDKQIAYELELVSNTKGVGLSIAELRNATKFNFNQRIMEYVSFNAPSVFISKNFRAEDSYDNRSIEIKVMPSNIIRLSDRTDGNLYIAVFRVIVDKSNINKTLSKAEKLLESKEVDFNNIPNKLYESSLRESFGGTEFGGIVHKDKGKGYVYSKYNKLGVHCYDIYKKGNTIIYSAGHGDTCHYYSIDWDGRKYYTNCGVDDRLHYLYGLTDTKPSKKYHKDCYY